MKASQLVLLLVGASTVTSQSSDLSSTASIFTTAPAPSSSVFSAPLPSGSAIAASYDGRWRPQVHYSPPVGFMNDPNGLFIDSKGIYHQYYQFNPYNTIAGNQTWGHATSTDLYHWENQAVALAPINGTDLVFSGSAVVDANNTSGFFPNQTDGVVAIFTVASPIQQTQNIAYSTDEGYTFTRYEGNPVLEIGSPNFRDPKVLWYEATSSWIMVISYAQDFTVGIYTSPNLINWTHASNWSHHGLLGYQYECPNLVQMPMEGQDEPMWLMYVSISPGAPYGGSIGQYFVGDFNGTHYTEVDSVARIADFGKDNYATQFWSGIPGDQHQISIAWASNWDYCNSVPTGPAEGWQSAFSLPRVNYLRNATRIGYQLVSQPYGIDNLKPSTALIQNDNFGNGTAATQFGRDEGTSGTILLEANITGLDTTATAFAASLNFTISCSETGESLSGGQLLSGSYSFWLDRGKTFGFQNPFFTEKFSVGTVLGDQYDLQLVVDRSILEAFILQGEKSATLSFFPEGKMDTIVISTSGLNPGAQVSMAVWELTSAWSTAANSSGLVPGNSTMKRSSPFRM